MIVGQYGSERRSCPVFPEMSVEWLEEELDTLPTRKYDKFEVSEKTRLALEEIFPYWHGRTLNERLFARMPGKQSAFASNPACFPWARMRTPAWAM